MKKICTGLLLPKIKTPIKTNRAMKLTCALLFAASFGVFATGNAQTMRVNIQVENVSTGKVLSEIEKQTDYLFVYNKNEVDLKRKTSVNAVNKTTAEVLSTIFNGTDIIYAIEGENIMLMRKEQNLAVVPDAVQQDNKITGTVLDPTGMPVIGANIMVKGTTNGTITDMDGKFSLEAREGAVLVVSYIGFANQEIKIGKQKQLSIALKEDSQALDELVVVGYTSQKRELLTGSVASMKVTEELKNVPSTSPADILAGQLSGVNVSTGDGLPGNQSSISIRAKSSWNDQDVLYVIDGMICDATDFNNLSANEIENVTVLKDAASAAIYGSRAAGGVVVVTTKGGSYSQKVKIDYSFNTGFDRRGKEMQLTDGVQTAELYMRINPTSDPAAWAWTPEEIEYMKTINNGWGYDWVEAVWQNPKKTTHNIGISGGSEKVKFFAGYSNTAQDGFLQNLSYKKNNFRLNMTAKLSDDLDVSGSIALSSNSTNSTTGAGIGDIYGVYQWLRGWQPDTPIFSDSGLPLDPSWVANVPAQVRGDAGYIKDKYLKPSINISATYKIPFVKGLSAKASYSKAYTNVRSKVYQKQYTLYITKKESLHKWSTSDADIIGTKKSSQIAKDYLQETSTWGDNWQYNLQLSYNRVFKDVHNVNATLVFEKYESNAGGMSAGIENFPVYNTDQWWATSSDRVDSYVARDSKYSDQSTGRQSWIGQFMYDYDGKYLLNASYRYDGSMNFAPEHRWGFFPSASLGWIISKESFFNTNIVDFMKLRASVGLTGNDAIGGWQWQQAYQSGNSVFLGTNNTVLPGITYGVLPNESLTWEKSLTYNVGVDMNLFQNINASMEYFFTNTYDILGTRNLDVPPTFSRQLPAENYGEVHANGFEVSLGYNNTFGDFNVSGSLVASYANSIYKKYDDDKVTYDYQKRVNRSLSAVYGFECLGMLRTESDLEDFVQKNPDYKFKGIAPEVGQLIYKDISGPNNVPDGIVDDYDQTMLRKQNNPIVLGLTLGCEWKGLAVNAVFNGNLGQERFIQDMFDIQEWNRMWVDCYYDSWTPENTDATLPKKLHKWSGNKTYMDNSSFWLKKSSFLRLKNLNVSYTIPSNLYSKWGLDKVQVYFVGSNMFILSGFNRKYYDPEVGGCMRFPIMKSYNFGINITI